MGNILALKRIRKAAIGAVVGVLVVSGLVSFGGGAAVAAEVSSPPPLLQRDANVVTSDPIPTVQIDNGYVWAQTTIGSTVYAVGKFDNAREPKAAPGTALTARSNVLAYDIQTGALLPFAPKVNGVIKAVAASPDGSRIYIGGSFNSVNGKDRWNIAALDAKTGELVPGFIPSIGGSGVYALTTSGTSVYAGGLFTQANGTARKNLTAFNAANGALLPWAPTTDQQVDTMVMDPAGKDAIIGGRFAQISGNTALRGIGAVDKTTGAVDTAWQVPNTVKNGTSAGASAGQSGIFGLATDATGVYGTGWAYAASDVANLEGTFAAEAGTGKIRWIADCLGDHYGVYSTGKVVYTTSHTHACSTMGLHPEQAPRTHRYSEAFTADARGTLGHQTNVPNYKDWAGTPAPSPYAWTPDWAVGTTSGLGQAGLSITGTGDMISIGGEFRSVNNGQFEGLVRFSTAPPGGAKDGPRITGDKWEGTARQDASDPRKVSVEFPSNWDRDDLTLTYELYRSGTTAPVATVNADATWWNLPKHDLVDTSAPAGALKQYTIVAKDSDGNTATGVVKAAIEPVGPMAIVARTSGKAVGVTNATEPQAVQQTLSASNTHRWTKVPKADGKFQLKNLSTGNCLAVSGGSTADSAPAIQWKCEEGAHFLWSQKYVGEGQYQFVAAHSGKCLTLDNGNTADGAKFLQDDCGAAPATSSQFTLQEAAQVTIASRASGKVVALNGTDPRAIQQTMTDSTWQRWTMIPKGDGKFQLKNYSGECLAVSGGVLTDSAPAIQYKCSDAKHFLWSKKDVGGGYSQLVAAHSGKCLTLENGNTAVGAGFVQYNCAATPAASSQFTLEPANQSTIVARDTGKALTANGTAPSVVQQTHTRVAPQKWVKVPKADGKFQLKNLATGMCLAVSGANQADWADVIQWSCEDGAHFLWTQKDLGTGYSQLIAAHSGKCLSLKTGVAADAATFIQFNCNSSAPTLSEFTVPAGS